MHDDTAATLSTADVAAMRLAEEVSLHYYEGTSFIRLYLGGSWNPETPRVFTARQQRLFANTRDVGAHERSRTIACEVAFAGYDEPIIDRSTVSCFWAGSAHRDTWRTVRELVKPGDRVALSWVAGNNNHYLDDAELFNDEVLLTVARGKRRLVFALGHAICAGNTARMIQRR
jgi:hypothetical protein